MNPTYTWGLHTNLRKLTVGILLGASVLLAGCHPHIVKPTPVSPPDTTTGPLAGSVLTQHNDSMRTGAYLLEKQLTPATVDSTSGSGMVLRYSRPVDGVLLPQLLYAHGVRINGTPRNVIYAFTDHNTVYAYDADEERDSGTNRGLIWSRTLPVTPNPALPVAVGWWGGILSTPVIDQSGGKLSLVYAISNGLYPAGGQGDGNPIYEVEYHLAVLDLGSGAVPQDAVVVGSVPSSVPPGHVDFVPRRQIQRAGLLLLRNPLNHQENTIYVAFGGRHQEETHNYHGWVMGYDEKTLAPRGVFCSTPDWRDVNEGGGIWQGGGGLAGDEDGNVYFTTGNGPGSGNNHGNSIVKLTPVLRAGKYDFNVQSFNGAADDPAHATEWANNDIDLGGGGITVIPGSSRVVAGSKIGRLYLLDRPAMTKVLSFDAFSVNPANDSDPVGARYRDYGSGPHLHGAWTYWPVSSTRGYIYHWAEKDFLRRFDYDRKTGQINPASVVTGDVLARPVLMPGGLMSLSANGNKDGLLWVTLPWDNSASRVMAYDALTLRRVWDTTLADSVSHNAPPTVADGKVIIGMQNNSFLVFGLASPHASPMAHTSASQRVATQSSAGHDATQAMAGPDPGPWLREYFRRLAPDKVAMLTPPKGHHAVFLAVSKGSLTYEVKLSAGTTSPQWVLAEISGELRDDSGVMPHMAYRGRGEVLATAQQDLTWKTTDGGSVRWSVQASVDAPQGHETGEIHDAPWVLFRSASSGGHGPLDQAVYVQLLGTAGGAPPASVGQLGDRVQVPYTGRYAFYVSDSGTQSTNAPTP